MRLVAALWGLSRQDNVLKTAYQTGMTTALAHFKVAEPLGAEPQSAPSHGTARRQYPPMMGANPAPGEPYDLAAQTVGQDLSDRLWDTSDIDHLAPGGAGEYGQEVIG